MPLVSFGRNLFIYKNKLLYSLQDYNHNVGLEELIRLNKSSYAFETFTRVNLGSANFWICIKAENSVVFLMNVRIWVET